MVVGEEVEALEGMGIGARRYLVGPRLLSVTLLTPCLVVVSNLAALAGAALICKMQFRLSFLSFGSLMMDALVFRDIVAGTIKSVLFGMLVGLRGRRGQFDHRQRGPGDRGGARVRHADQHRPRGAL